MIVGVRLDHRLVHGQVAVAWTHHLNVSRIILVSDAVYADEFQTTVIKMSKPAGVKLNIFSVEKALEKMPKVEQLNDRIFIVFGTVEDLSRFVKGYPKLSEVNYGGTKKRENTKEITETIFLDPKEVDETKEILSSGVKIFIQQLPSSKRTELTLSNL